MARRPDILDNPPEFSRDQLDWVDAQIEAQQAAVDRAAVNSMTMDACHWNTAQRRGLKELRRQMVAANARRQEGA